MQGIIKKVHARIGVGILTSAEGRDYRFFLEDILNPDVLVAGIEVDFIDVAGRPREIILMAGSAWTAFGRIEVRDAGLPAHEAGRVIRLPVAAQASSSSRLAA